MIYGSDSSKNTERATRILYRLFADRPVNIRVTPVKTKAIGNMMALAKYPRPSNTPKQIDSPQVTLPLRMRKNMAKIKYTKAQTIESGSGRCGGIKRIVDQE